MRWIIEVKNMSGSSKHDHHVISRGGRAAQHASMPAGDRAMVGVESGKNKTCGMSGRKERRSFSLSLALYAGASGCALASK